MNISKRTIEVYGESAIIVGIFSAGLLPLVVFIPILEFFVAIWAIYILIAAIFVFVVYFMKEDGLITIKEE